VASRSIGHILRLCHPTLGFLSALCDPTTLFLAFRLRHCHMQSARQERRLPGVNRCVIRYFYTLRLFLHLCYFSFFDPLFRCTQFTSLMTYFLRSTIHLAHLFIDSSVLLSYLAHVLLFTSLFFLFLAFVLYFLPHFIFIPLFIFSLPSILCLSFFSFYAIVFLQPDFLSEIVSSICT
jgi:hypothetical protein